MSFFCNISFDEYYLLFQQEQKLLQGVPVRVEIGPKDLKEGQVVTVRRDTGEKIIIQRQHAVSEIQKLLENIQQNLYNT